MAARAIEFRTGLLIRHAIIIVVLCLTLGSCSSKPQRAPAIGEAFVGPISLNLRQDLAPRAAVTATVKHGERLEILEYRRRFAKVRTAADVEGWTDGRQLLSPEQMGRLRRSAEHARQLPSQGKAMPFDLLNVHIEANRQSPSFYQIAEEETVDLIGHRVAPRVPYTPERNGAPPPVPPGTPNDAWSLVRLSDGRAGWVLSRMIMMAIPDEVAQYAEGHHITSYASLGTVNDRGQTKHHWLWTTAASRLEPYHFDSFRVFVWSLRRHRYETAYIERNLRGYYPVEVHATQEGAAMPRFSLTFAGKDGVVYRRTYEFQGYHVRMIQKAPWEISADEADEASPAESEAEQQPAPSGSLVDRIRSRWKEWVGK